MLRPSFWLWMIKMRWCRPTEISARKKRLSGAFYAKIKHLYQVAERYSGMQGGWRAASDGPTRLKTWFTTHKIPQPAALQQNDPLADLREPLRGPLWSARPRKWLKNKRSIRLCVSVYTTHKTTGAEILALHCLAAGALGFSTTFYTSDQPVRWGSVYTTITKQISETLGQSPRIW